MRKPWVESSVEVCHGRWSVHHAAFCNLAVCGSADLSQAEQRGGIIAVVCPVASRRQHAAILAAFLTECVPARVWTRPRLDVTVPLHCFDLGGVSIKKLSVEEETDS